MQTSNTNKYSNTIIYKICCKDISNTDIYIGHTTNFESRRNQHKLTCNTVLHNNSKLYTTIRENGGWENWEMVEIAKYDCKDSTEARKKEQEHFLMNNCTLNTIAPFTDQSNLYCEICNIYCPSSTVYIKHLNSKLHIQRENNTVEEKDFKFFCEICNFKCINKHDYSRHCTSKKHHDRINLNNCIDNVPHKYICKCGKKYNHRQSLHFHSKSCSFEEEQNLENNHLINMLEETHLMHKQLLSLLTNTLSQS